MSGPNRIDWGQVLFNGGPPCFHIEGDSYCLRAERWDGHGDSHAFVSLPQLLDAAREQGRREGMEEAARVADEIPITWDDKALGSGSVKTKKAIAAAIRALAKEESGDGEAGDE